MLRSVALGFAAVFVAACTTVAPAASPTSAPSSSAQPTQAPTASPAPTTAPPSAAATVVPTGSAAPTTAPPGGSTAETCGVDWSTSAGECGGEEGDHFLFQCPSGGRDLSIWGTDIYTSDSAVCTAAVHAGLITLAAGGTVTVEIRPGQASYVGSTRNGITSGDYGSWGSSFAFVDGAVAQPTPSPAPPPGYAGDILLFSDDFSDTSGGWDTETSANGTIAYVDEALQVDLNGSFSYLSNTDAVLSPPATVIRIEALFTTSGGDGANYAGLMCGNDPEDMAGAVIGTNGAVAFLRREGGEFASLDYWQGPTLLVNDNPARLALDCVGTDTGQLRLRVWFNGAPLDEFVGEATGPASFDRVGLYVEGTNGSTFRLDDLQIFGGSAGPPPSPGGSASPSGELAALLAHVPEQMRQNCSEVTTLSAGEVISAQCLPAGIDGYLTYTLFDNDGDMQDKFFGDADYFFPGGFSNDAGDCSAGPAWNAYNRDGLVYGRLFCNTYTGISPDGMIMHWFDDTLLIEAGVVLHSGTFSELYDTFMMAGPIP